MPHPAVFDTSSTGQRQGAGRFRLRRATTFLVLPALLTLGGSLGVPGAAYASANVSFVATSADDPRITVNTDVDRCPYAKWRGQLGHELWVSRASTTELTMRAGFGGDTDGLAAKISADAKQVNDSSHTKTYVPTASGAKICGQDGNPTQTEKVLENEG